MAEVSNITFTYKEVVESLIKRQNLHEGIWQLFVRFGLSAANIGPTEDAVQPAAIIPIMEIGLQKAEKENNMSVDAAKGKILHLGQRRRVTSKRVAA